MWATHLPNMGPRCYNKAYLAMKLKQRARCLQQNHIFRMHFPLFSHPCHIIRMHNQTVLLHGIGQKVNRISWLLFRFQGQLAHSAHTFLLSLILVTIVA